MQSQPPISWRDDVEIDEDYASGDDGPPDILGSPVKLVVKLVLLSKPHKLGAGEGVVPFSQPHTHTRASLVGIGNRSFRNRPLLHHFGAIGRYADRRRRIPIAVATRRALRLPA